MNREAFNTIRRNIRLDGGRTNGVFQSYGFHAVFDGETLSFIRDGEVQLRGVCVDYISNPKKLADSVSARMAMVRLTRNAISDVRLP